jgi:hypothetical protein
MLQHKPSSRLKARGKITMTASTGDGRFRAAGIGVLAAILFGWIVLSVFAVTRQGTWADEAGYIIKSWWYISGAVKPYSAEDATWYQPLMFYALGSWQWIFGHDIVSSRAFSLVITAVNIGLLASLLHRLGCTVWPIAFAIVVYALTEDSIFYFDSATPFAGAICLQLAALHLLVGMHRRASFAIAIAFGAVLTAIYLLRINLMVFIALCLAVAWVRAGRDRWRVYLCAATIFLMTWSSLAMLWGRQFVYVTLWLPIVTDWLVQAGILPKLYPNIAVFSHQNVIPPPAGLKDMLAYAFSYGMLRYWIIGHHVVPMAAASIAMIVAALRPMRNRGWIAFFAASYWGLLLFHHLGAQSYCPICIQAYANFFDYLAALAGGLCLNGLLQNSPTVRSARAAAVGAVVAAVGLSAAQAWSLSGGNKLPSIRNQTDSLPHEIRVAGEAIRTLLPAGSKVELVGSDARIPLALASADVRVPPVTLSLVSFYRKLDENLTPEQQAQTIEEIRQLSVWTDVIAQEWIQDAGDWMVVQRQPVGYVYPWLVWTPDGPLVKTGLEKCFELVAEPAFNQFDPPLSIALYRRVRRGRICLGE